MGRQLKRIALDFDNPIGKVWSGYLSPSPSRRHARPCAKCAGGGSSDLAYAIYQKWYGYKAFSPAETGSTPWSPQDPDIRRDIEHKIARASQFYGTGEDAITKEAVRMCGIWNTQLMHHLTQADVDALVAAGRLMDLTHTWTRETGWQPRIPAVKPTAAEVNRWSLFGMGHDSINQWVVVKARCKQAGVPSQCSSCQGEGKIWRSARTRARFEKWQGIEPPVGEGYQVWETVSEGSPISPVFAVPADLATWLVSNRKGSIDDGTNFEQWMSFIQGPGWAPSAVSSGGQMLTGVQALN